MFFSRWSGAQAAYRDPFDELVKKHSDTYEKYLSNITFMTSTESAATEEVTEQENQQDGGSDEVNEFESIEKLKNDLTVAHECGSKVHGVTIYITEDNKIFLSSARDKVVPPKSILGGIGNGIFQGFDQSVNGVKVDFSQGDATLVQLDKTDIDGSAPETMTLYNALRWLERQGKTQQKMSFFTVSRKSGGDGYDLEPDASGPQMFKVLSKAELDRMSANAVPKKKAKQKDLASDSTIFADVASTLPSLKLAAMLRP